MNRWVIAAGLLGAGAFAGTGLGYLVASHDGAQAMGQAGEHQPAPTADAAGAGVGSTAGDSAAAMQSAPVPVEVAVAGVPAGAAAVRATGTLRYQREIPLGFKVAGVVRQLNVDAGDRVAAGTVLARLDPAEVAARQRDAQAQLDNALRDLLRTKVMVQRGFMAPAAQDNAQMLVDRARATLDALAFDSAKAVIRAPADGIVLGRLAEPGQTLAPGASVVLFGDLGSGLVLVAPLSDRQLGRVRLGDVARVVFTSMSPVEAHVSRVAGMADPRTGAFDVELKLSAMPAERRAALRSGLVGEAQIAGSAVAQAQTEQLGVPAIAVLEGRGDRASVYRISADGRAFRVPIRIAGLFADNVLVAEGLLAGDRVVTAGAAYLRNGQRVTVIKASASVDSIAPALALAKQAPAA